MTEKEAVLAHFMVGCRHFYRASEVRETAGTTAKIRTAYFILKTHSSSQQHFT
jgi:hypothetical protein